MEDVFTETEVEIDSGSPKEILLQKKRKEIPCGQKEWIFSTDGDVEVKKQFGFRNPLPLTLALQLVSSQNDGVRLARLCHIFPVGFIEQCI